MGRRAKRKSQKLEIEADIEGRELFIWNDTDGGGGISWDLDSEGVAASACYLLGVLQMVTGIKASEILRIVNETHTSI